MWSRARYLQTSDDENIFAKEWAFFGAVSGACFYRKCHRIAKIFANSAIIRDWPGFDSGKKCSKYHALTTGMKRVTATSKEFEQ